MNGAGRRVGLAAIFLVSGAPGLAAQLAWVRVFSAGLGHEMPSLIGVVSAFFAGLALGAWLLGGGIQTPARALGWYAGLEWGCAAWVALTTFLLDGATELALTWAGPEASPVVRFAVAFGIPLVVVGPAAAALGGTLPAMERVMGPGTADGRAVAALYALNTVGAIAGVLGAVFWAMPVLGFRGTLWLSAGVQVLLGAGAWTLGFALGPGPGMRTRAGAGVGVDEAGGRGFWLGWTAWGAGFLGLGYELLGLRVLAQTTENTVHTYAAVLAVFLASTAVGAAGYRWLERRGRAPHRSWLLAGLSGLVLLGMVASSMAPLVLGWCRRVGWDGLGVELVLAGWVFAAPSLAMGALFSSVVQGAAGREGGVGRAVAWNTLGAAVAGPVWLGWVLPWAGLKGALGLVAAGYGLLLPPGIRMPWRIGGPAMVLGIALLVPGQLHWIEVPPGAEVVRWIEGRMASVAVVLTPDGHRALRVNSHFQQGGTATAGAARRQAHLPLLLHPGPRRALFLGVGTGVTLGAAAAHPGLEADGVELLPEVAGVLGLFAPENGSPQERAGFRVMTGDARRYVRTTRNRYDVVVGDLFHPSEDGAGFLYTREHFGAIRGCLAPGGLVCQWLPLHQLDIGVFRDVVRTFREVFPDATLWLLRSNIDVPVVGLVSGGPEGGLDVEALGRRLASPGLAAALRPLAMNDPVRVLGFRVADAAGVGRMAAGGVVATDDRPRVLFRAAGDAYREGARPHQRLATLLEEAEPGFDGLVSGLPGKSAWVDRLSAFRRSRDAHLHGLIREVEGRRKEAVREYVASASASADYTAGYAQAVLVASAFAREDPEFARGILQQLILARPEQRLAGEVLERVDDPGVVTRRE